MHQTIENFVTLETSKRWTEPERVHQTIGNISTPEMPERVHRTVGNA